MLSVMARWAKTDGALPAHLPCLRPSEALPHQGGAEIVDQLRVELVTVGRRNAVEYRQRLGERRRERHYPRWGQQLYWRWQGMAVGCGEAVHCLCHTMGELKGFFALEVPREHPAGLRGRSRCLRREQLEQLFHRDRFPGIAQPFEPIARLKV
jgi:hypothetical protein